MTQLASAGYEQLKVEISRVFIEGHERARLAVERERVATCWEVGRLLDGHLRDQQAGSGYGERMMAQLGVDLELEVRRLYEMLEVFRAFPKLRIRNFNFQPLRRSLSTGGAGDAGEAREES